MARDDTAGRDVTINEVLTGVRRDMRCFFPSHLFCRLIVATTVGLLLSGCGSVRYYGQAIRGQAQLMVERRALTKVLDDPATDPAVAARLQLAQQARRFASRQLRLPDNRSYTTYVDLHRPYVVWNVFATPPYSVEALPQCFPVAGCVAYRGWFSASAAHEDAAHLRAGGADVWVGGVSAYSTLGWFADPLISSMLGSDDDTLAGTIFHELAHQLIYVKGDTAFNESFASFVQSQGLRQWRQSKGLPRADGTAEKVDKGFSRLVLDLRAKLAVLYASGAADTVLEAGKQREIEAFRGRYARWRDATAAHDHRYDAWMAAPINNARLLPFRLYDQWVPAFERLLVRAGGNWTVFYASVNRLARQPEAARRAALQELEGARP